jgi:hypothetical protein
MVSIYQKIGGRKTLEKIVDNFYSAISRDKRVNHLLDGIELESQKLRTFVFLAALMGEKLITNKRLTGKYLTSEQLTEEEFYIFEKTWFDVLVKMDLTYLEPIIWQGMYISKCVKEQKTKSDFIDIKKFRTLISLN